MATPPTCIESAGLHPDERLRTGGSNEDATHARVGGVAGEIADLEQLAAGLSSWGCKTVLVTRDGGLPTLDVVNGMSPGLSRRVCTSAGHFWWSDAGHIARCDQISAAIRVIAQTVRVTGERR